MKREKVENTGVNELSSASEAAQITAKAMKSMYKKFFSSLVSVLVIRRVVEMI